ncbi:hypothetical protein K2Z84_05295 [Candidatus Binatia bacterium]|nr:hypothetical protein [Candidatus Binatia bacterium]
MKPFSILTSITDPVQGSGKLELTSRGKMRIEYEIDLAGDIVDAAMSGDPNVGNRLRQSIPAALSQLTQNLFGQLAQGHPAQKAGHLAVVPNRLDT